MCWTKLDLPHSSKDITLPETINLLNVASLFLSSSHTRFEVDLFYVVKPLPPFLTCVLQLLEADYIDFSPFSPRLGVACLEIPSFSL